MLHLIGLGLHPPGSLTLAAWETLQHAGTIYLDTYTSAGFTASDLASFLKKPVIAADRALVESERIIEDASTRSVALCVIGDIFTATTHSVLYLECLKRDILVALHPNAGIVNAITVSGLELYKFGQTVSIPYASAGYEPSSWAAKIAANRAAGLHTLCLLDIKADEGRFMSIPEGIALLRKHVPELPLLIGAARIGTENVLLAGTPEQLTAHAWPGPLHSIIIPGPLNAIEEEFVARWKV